MWPPDDTAREPACCLLTTLFLPADGGKNVSPVLGFTSLQGVSSPPQRTAAGQGHTGSIRAGIHTSPTRLRLAQLAEGWAGPSDQLVSSTRRPDVVNAHWRADHTGPRPQSDSTEVMCLGPLLEDGAQPGTLKCNGADLRQGRGGLLSPEWLGRL